MSPAFNGCDVGDIENCHDGDDMAASKKFVDRLENHPPEEQNLRGKLTKAKTQKSKSTRGLVKTHQEEPVRNQLHKKLTL